MNKNRKILKTIINFRNEPFDAAKKGLRDAKERLRKDLDEAVKGINPEGDPPEPQEKEVKMMKNEQRRLTVVKAHTSIFSQHTACVFETENIP